MHSEKMGAPADFVDFAILRSFSHYGTEMTALQPNTDKKSPDICGCPETFAACQMFMAAS